MQLRILFLIFFFLSEALYATYIFKGDIESNSSVVKEELFELILKTEPPRVYYEEHPLDLHIEAKKIIPNIELKWIPPTLWQLSMLHAFFFNQEIRSSILTYANTDGEQCWSPLCYDDMFDDALASSATFKDVLAYFDYQSQSLPKLSELFFKVNAYICSIYERSEESYDRMLQLMIREFPDLDEWKDRGFPIYKSPWMELSDVERFYKALKDIAFLSEIIEIEISAYGDSEWVLYRGYRGDNFPTTLQENKQNLNHALSFGSTLLGGTFFSLDATALTYSKPHRSFPYTFLALRMNSKELLDVFQLGPLHPFLQMLVDGEMFHAHTKVAAKSPLYYINNPLQGYFMKCNKHYLDPIGYLLSFTMDPEDLEKQFLQICNKSSKIFSYVEP